MSQIIGIYGITDRFDHPYPAYVHDHNVTLMEDGMIKGYVHLERHSRRKYDNRLGQYIEELLLEGTWDVQPDAQWVFVNTFVGNDFQSRGGRLRFELQAKPQIHVEGQRGWGWWQYAAWEGREINAYMLSHELAHIGACLPFYGAFKDNSLLVHFDGGASQSNFSAFLYREGEVNPLAHHWELSHLSKFYNDHALTFRILKSSPGMHTSVPGKLMGYAALGNYRPELVPWLVAHDYFRMIWKNEAYFYRAAEKQWGWQGSLDDQHDPFLLDVAATLQEIFIQGILQTLQQLQEIHQADFLYYSGGCALNILANQRILDRGLFQEVFIPPCCSDSGLSLGAVAWMSWQQGRAVAKHSPYLNEWLPIERVDYTPEDIQSVGKLLVQGKLVAICNGKGEVGPRALGNRSILGRADDPALSQHLSMSCKQREWYRPIAPVMLGEVLEKVTGQSIPIVARYMLTACEVLPAYRTKLAGALHRGRSARAQAVMYREQNPFLFDLLTHCYEEYGMLGLLNTSFNRRGEPIVQTEAEAQNAAREMKLDGLVLNGRLQMIKKEYETISRN